MMTPPRICREALGTTGRSIKPSSRRKVASLPRDASPREAKTRQSGTPAPASTARRSVLKGGAATPARNGTIRARLSASSRKGIMVAMCPGVRRKGMKAAGMKNPYPPQHFGKQSTTAHMKASHPSLKALTCALFFSQICRKTRSLSHVTAWSRLPTTEREPKMTPQHQILS